MNLGRAGLAALVGLGWMLAAGAAHPAWAEGESALALKQSGNEKMVDSDFVGAIADYQQALALAPNDVALLYNIGRAHGFLGHHPEALAALETFEARATPEQKAKIAQLAELIADTRRHVGYLTVACAIPHARVQLGARVVGEAPLARIAVETERTTVKIEAEGYLDDVRAVTIMGAAELALDCRLLPRSTSGTLVANATPTGARLSVDGKFLGNNHVEITLPAGPHTILAEQAGYERASSSVVIAAGGTKTLDVQLRPTVPITARWWFWGGLAVVVAGGTALTVALLTERSADKGSIPPQQLGAPLRF
jgi:hypothetical protein